MNDSVSMFDFGMLRLETAVNEILLSRHQISEAKRLSESADISYNWKKNRIEILIVVFVPKERLKSISAKEYCKIYTLRVRNLLITSLPDEDRVGNGVFKYFKHYGYKNDDEPKKLMNEIENITYIYVRILEQANNSASMKASSESPLMGDEILFNNK